MTVTIRRLGPVLALAFLVLVAGLPGEVVGDDVSDEIGEMVSDAVAFLLASQEGEPRAEWPYEGVYREDGAIPMGYRVGGTALVSRALLAAPGFDDDAARREAVARATGFVVASSDSELMAHAIEQNYDVRGWGYACALHLLAELVATERVPAGMQAAVGEAAEFFLAGIAATEIPESGGWNYSRRAGFDAPGSSSPFMTATTCQALFAARDVGWDVDGALVERALVALERTRSEDGGVVYAGVASTGGYSGLPGAVGRMLAVESTLFLAGRITPDRVRGSIDAFFVHWKRLEERRAKTGTHKPPYGVAPYYFYYAHHHAGQAIELLPEGQRDEYRRHLVLTLLRTRDGEGTWNDRVFPRSAAYGTAMAVLALTAPWASPGGSRDASVTGELRQAR